MKGHDLEHGLKSKVLLHYDFGVPIKAQLFGSSVTRSIGSKVVFILPLTFISGLLEGRITFIHCCLLDYLAVSRTMYYPNVLSMVCSRHLTAPTCQILSTGSGSYLYVSQIGFAVLLKLNPYLVLLTMMRRQVGFL